MGDTPSPVRIEVRIASDFRLTDMVHALFTDVGRHLGMDEEELHWTSLALREGVNNAIKHGHKGDLDKEVRVLMFTRGSELVVQVMDRGQGFKPDKVPDPTAPENLLKTSGRGVFFIHRFTDGYRVFRRGGWFIMEMRRRLTAPQAQTR